MYDDVMTRNDDGELAVRTVSATEGTNPSSYDDVFTRTTDGKLAMRVVGNGGGGGGDSHNKGYFATQAALEEAYPTAEAGDWAIVGATDTVWIWDTDNSEWVDSHKADSVTSVNGQTGAVVLDAEDVGALPEDTPIPDPQVQSDWDQTDPTAVDYIKNKPVIPQGGIPQYETMPTASASNLGEIAQYSGETIPDIPASATITQTTGSGLTDLAVNVNTFEGVEQPSGAETVTFTASNVSESLSPTQAEVGDGILTIDQGVFLAQWRNYFGEPSNITQFEIVVGDNTQDVNWNIGFYYDNTVSYTMVNHTEFGLNYSGTGDPQTGCLIQYTRAGTHWSKGGTEVNLANYGISYSGSPADGDVLTVSYTPLVAGITNGYFYKSLAEYSNPTATISQTTGSGLTDLAIDVNTFVEAEQPTQNEQVAFEASVTGPQINTNVDTGSFAVTAFDLNTYRSCVERFGNTWSDSWLSGEVLYSEWEEPDPADPETTMTFWDWSLTTQDGQWGLTVTDPTEMGFTISGPVYDGDHFTFVITDNEVTWEKDGEPADPAAYGVSYSGTVADGDVLTVSYTAPVAIGYHWERTDVQPSSGGDSGIQWTRHLDKPDNEYWDTEQHLAAIFNKLPAGHYKWYFSVCTYTNADIPLKNYCTFAVDFIIKYDESQNPRVDGSVNWVLDGSTSFYSSTFHFNSNYDISFGIDPDGDTSKMDMRSELLKTITQGTYAAIDNCCLWGDIVNVDTGEKIEVEIVRGSPSDYNFGSAGMGWALELDLQPDTSNWAWNIPDSIKGFCINTNYLNGEILVSARYGSDSLEATLKNIGNQSQPRFFVKSKKATGLFANSYFVESDTTNVVALIHDFPQGSSEQLVIKVVKVGKELNESVYSWALYDYQYPDYNFTRCSTTEVGSTVTYDNYGMIEQYTGVTDANYTNGYFYKADGTVVDVPQSVTPINYSVPDVTITVDATDLIAAIQNVTGWQVSDIISYLSGYEWRVTYDADNDMVTQVWFGAYGDFDSSTGIPQLFTVTASGLSGEQYIGFMMQYTAGHKEVQNGFWTRVDVQPSGGGSSPTTTTATLAVNDWNNGSQTVNVSGVTASNLVQVAPAPSSTSDYVSGGVLCTAQGAGTLTFTCTTTPSNAITVNVVIF